jgi:hypothetical protein
MHWLLALMLWCISACARAPSTPAEQAERIRERADRLHRSAIELQSDLRWARRAARLHRESARLRPPSDPRGYECYLQASGVLIAAGRMREAQQLMEESIEFALARGDTVSAARSRAEAVRITSINANRR